MDKATLIKELTAKNKAFVDYIEGLSDEDFSAELNGKWSAGQNLEHIFLAIRPLHQALSLPIFLFALFGGNGKSSSYDELVNRYQNKLKNGAKATRSYIPKKVSSSQKAKLTRKLTKAIDALAKKVDKLSETNLDKYRLPHPIIGLITIREMLYFSIYHPQHHQKSVVDNLTPRK